MQQKFPDVSAFAVGSLVGSFFMLRFINPAVVTPQAYMLVDQQLSAQARRTTTLVRHRISPPIHFGALPLI